MGVKRQRNNPGGIIPLGDGGGSDMWDEILQGILYLNLLRISDFVASLRLGQSQNALPPIVVTLGGMVIEVRLTQLENVPWPIFLTLAGMMIEVRRPQQENAPSPIVVTLGGMVIEIRL